MRGMRTRLTGTWLALLALATLLVVSFGHTHNAPASDRASKPLECRLPFAANANPDCPPLHPDHIHCAVCLAANSAATAVPPYAPVLLTQVLFETVTFASNKAPLSHGTMTLPFQARGPPSV